MAPKKIIFSPQAEKEIKALQEGEQKKIFAGLKSWKAGEIRPDIEKIKSQPDFYRLRLGKFRVIYCPLSSERVVLLLIRDRKDAYQDLGNLRAKLSTAMRKLNIVGAAYR